MLGPGSAAERRAAFRSVEPSLRIEIPFMAEMTAGAALRQLQQAQAGMKKARQALRLARDDSQAVPHLLQLGWKSLAQSHRLIAAIPLSAANEAVMTKQLAVQRYGTAL